MSPPPSTMGTVRRRTAMAITAMLLASSGLAACGVQAGDRAPAAEAPADDRTPPAPLLRANEVDEAIGGSLALVSTPTGTGSAVQLANGYLVTSAHVVDPFDAVDLTFEGGTKVEGVAVVGVDLVADLAVLGPLDDPPPALALDAPTPVEGDPAFLVGYPGDHDPDDPAVVVKAGEIDGTEPIEGWDLDLVASTTPIEGGQSGGALVSGRGEVLGISGLSDDDGRALSVPVDEVAARVAEIVDGEGQGDDDWLPVPAAPDRTDFSFFVEGSWDAKAIFLPAMPESHRVEVTVEGAEPLLAVGSTGNSYAPWAISDAIVPDDEDDFWFAEDVEEEVRSEGPRRWSFRLGAYEDAILTVSSKQERQRLQVELSHPGTTVRGEVDGPALAVGEPERFAIGSLDDFVYLEVDLEAGTTYEIAARSPSADVAWSIEPSDGEAYEEDGADADDGGGGIFDYDAVDLFTPARTTTYSIWVYEYARVPTEVEVLVREA